MNNPAVKRLLKEYREFEREPSDQYTAAPLEVNNIIANKPWISSIVLLTRQCN
jgi:ubiquitin-protein ligase